MRYNLAIQRPEVASVLQVVYMKLSSTSPRVRCQVHLAVQFTIDQACTSDPRADVSLILYGKKHEAVPSSIST